MEFSNHIIQRSDSRNIILFRKGQVDKDGSPKPGKDVTYHASVENALLSLRRRLKNRKDKEDYLQLCEEFKKVDEKFLKEIDSNVGTELARLIQDALNDSPSKIYKEDLKVLKTEPKKVKKKKLYLASGWFTPDQVEHLDILENLVKSQSKYDFFAPRMQNCGVEGKSDWDIIYKRNIDELSECTHMIAITTDKDIGTMVEVGQFLNQGKPVIFFAPSLEGKFNLMLAKPAHRVCTSVEELKDCLLDIDKKEEYSSAIE